MAGRPVKGTGGGEARHLQSSFENNVQNRIYFIVQQKKLTGKNGFMMDEVGHSVCATAREIVPNIDRLAEAVRQAGGAVVWIQNAATEETLRSWSVRVEMDGPERTSKRLESMTPGSKGYEIWAAGLRPILTELLGPPAKETAGR